MLWSDIFVTYRTFNNFTNIFSSDLLLVEMEAIIIQKVVEICEKFKFVRKDCYFLNDYGCTCKSCYDVVNSYTKLLCSCKGDWILTQ